jgi:purine catabolism regulatory family protein/PucR-like helix-turn-helix protein
MSCPVAITVRAIVEVPDLRTWVHAGEGGLDREVAWAHVCEMPDPAEWLGAGDLLMTTGMAIPAEPDAQRRFVEGLADAGLSGIAIGDRMYAPEVSDEMCAAADERAFPLLFTAYEVPFSAMARAVADANRNEEHARVLETLRLYETARHASVGAQGGELLARLQETVGGRLFVVDHLRGVGVMAGADEPAPAVLAKLAEAAARREEPMPAVLRLEADGAPFLAVAVPASRPTTLVVQSDGEPAADLGLLRHVAGLVALEIEREIVERERRRAAGAELLAGLVDGRLTGESAAHLLDDRGLGDEPRVIAACPVGHDDAIADLHLRLEDRAIAHAALRRAPWQFVLLADDDEAIAALRAEVPDTIAIGLSGPLGRVARAADAVREASWAARAATGDTEGVVRYGERAPSLFLPRGLSETREAVDEVLGPLLRYDAAHESDLVRSLRVFLELNRSWKDAAAALHIHKQTLVYRMRRVEELTGRRLSDTGALADLWLALKAAEWSGTLPAD